MASPWRWQTISDATGLSDLIRILNTRLGQLSTVLTQLWNRVFGIYDPMDYGALGDGATDDSDAWARTLALATAAGSPVTPSPGVYVVANVATPGGAVIQAVPGTVTLKHKVLAALDGSPMLDVLGSSVTIYGVRFDGNKAAQPADGFADAFDTGPNNMGRAYRAAIRMKDTGSLWSGLTVDHCSFVSTYGACVATLHVARVRVFDCIADACNFELAFLYATTAGASFFAGHQVLRNRLTNIGSAHATVNADGIVLTCAEDFQVLHNIVATVERCGVKCEYARRGLIAGNVIDTNTITSFEAIQLQSTSLSVRVTKNVTRNTGLGITLNPQVGQTSTGCSVDDNTIEGTTSPTNGDGISVGNGSLVDLQLHNNNLTGIKRNIIGIQPNGTVRGLSIKGNIGATTGTTAGCGVKLNANGGNWQVAVVEDCVLDCGNAALAAAGVFITSADGSTIGLLKLADLLVVVGAGHNGVREAVACVTSGICDDTYTDGAISLQSGTFRCGENNHVIPGAGSVVNAPGLVRTATTTPVAVSADDTYVLTTMAVASPVVVNLPQFPQIGKRLRIKDGKNDAATNNVTVTAFAGHSIDTLGTYVIRSNFGVVDLVYISTNIWRVWGGYHPIAAALADMVALTAPATFSAAYTKTESEALRADVAALRTVVNTLLANRRTAGEQL
jgi:hypothetical protein